MKWSAAWLCLLFAAVLGSALGVVYSKYQNRKLFIELQALQTRRDEMSVEWGRLQLEQSTWAAHGRWWSHLASDASFTELHDFAARCGVPARGFERDHYDVPAEHYEALVAAGAVPTPSRELVARLSAAGLRRRRER